MTTTTALPEIVSDVPVGLERGLRHYWYPILRSDDLAGPGPIAVEVLGERLAVWRDAQGHPNTVVDRCPHRGARLSIGRLLGGQLQCRFHGLRFTGHGECALIPWLPDESPTRQEVWVTSYPARELGGYIWAYLGDTERFPAPPLEDEVPEELRSPEEYLWYWLRTEVWDTNWLVAIDGGDTYHAVTLHAESQAVASTTWTGGAVERPTVPLEQRRVKIVQASHGLRGVAVDLEGRPIHHGHVFDPRGERFIVPALFTNPLLPVPGIEPVVSRLWLFAQHSGTTLVQRYIVQRIKAPEQVEQWPRLVQEVIAPRMEAVAREDAIIAAAQGDLVGARAQEYLFEPDSEMYGVRLHLKQAFLAQTDGQRLAPTREALVYPV